MKKCILCKKKIRNDAPKVCEECTDALDDLAGLEPPKDLADEIVDLEETELPF